MLLRRILCGCLALSLSTCALPALTEDPEDRWERAIQKFEAKDREDPPAKGGVLFVGSSNIVLWDLDKCFPDLGALNRGFGGSTIADLNHFFDRVVAPYAPKMIVLYSGDNDVASGKKASEVYADFQELVAKIDAALPEARLFVMSIKPSTARWKLYAEMDKANELISKRCAEHTRLTFVDCESAMLGEDGTPDASLLRKDGLHLNDACYAKWTALLKMHLEAEEAQKSRV